MSGRYDVAVIGGGHNGLVAAAYLAQAGQSVVVLEKRPTVGGTASTIEVAPGYRASSCFQSAETFSPTISRELNLSGHGLEVSRSRGTSVVALDGQWLLFDGSGHPTGNGSQMLSMADRAAIAELERFLHRTVRALAPLYQETLPKLQDLGASDTLDLLRIGWRLRQLGRRDMREAIRFLPMSIRDVVEERFESHILGAAIAGLGLQGGCVGPYAPGTAFVALHHQIQNPRPLFSGPMFVKGGLGCLSDALSAAAQAAGAEVRTEAEVGLIDTTDALLQGVTLCNGDHVEASIVVSDLGPRRTLLSLVDPRKLAPEFINAVSTVRARGGVGVVSFALDGIPDPPEGSAEVSLSGRVQIGASVVEQERAFDAMQCGELAEKPFLQLTIPTLADPGLAPDGKHVATAWVLGVPDNFDSLEESVASGIETVLPGFTSRVVGFAVATPSDIEERYGATNGCLFGVDVSLDQALFLRPLPGWYRYNTPLRGLYLCGSSTHAGGGITGLPGRNAARRIIEDLKAGKVG